MLSADVSFWFYSVTAGFTAALGLSYLLSRDFMRPYVGQPVKPPSMFDDPRSGTVFLFDGDIMLDATENARAMLANTQTGQSDWVRVRDVLDLQFPEFLGRLRDIRPGEPMTFDSEDGQARLTASSDFGTLRLEYQDFVSETPTEKIEAHRIVAMRRELETLRAATEHCPFLVWSEDRDGRVTWANRAYMDAVERLMPEHPHDIWPPVTLFDVKSETADHGDGASFRKAIQTKSGSMHWFECHSGPSGDETLFTAIDANAAVAAETQLKEFMQTLTKTFAHLTIGLAIFDRGRRLALFNPALTDLTSLPVDFLTGRPTLVSFLDRLRDRRMIPEPKDYGSWRGEIAALEAAAADGTYVRTWTLPNGRTYRVTGRPHPDGAIAFLFEDISTEMSLTRRFRSELELGQAVVDMIDDAIAVFAPNGVLTMTNRAYADLWGLGEDDAAHDLSLAEVTDAWKQKCAPTPVWQDLCAFVLSHSDRSEWNGMVRHLDGRGVSFLCCPMPGGSTMVKFTQTDAAQDELISVQA